MVSRMDFFISFVWQCNKSLLLYVVIWLLSSLRQDWMWLLMQLCSRTRSCIDAGHCVPTIIASLSSILMPCVSLCKWTIHKVLKEQVALLIWKWCPASSHFIQWRLLCELLNLSSCYGFSSALKPLLKAAITMTAPCMIWAYTSHNTMSPWAKAKPATR
jgi:hypothetical protein